MSTQITLTLSDEIFQHAESLSRRTGRPIADVLSEAIELSLVPLGGTSTDDRAPSTWIDEEVLAAADTELADADDRRLSDLLAAQQERALDDAERVELTTLMERYQRGLLRRAVGIREAVERGLREAVGE